MNTPHKYFSLQFTPVMKFYFAWNTFNRNVFWKMKYEQIKQIFFWHPVKSIRITSLLFRIWKTAPIFWYSKDQSINNDYHVIAWCYENGDEMKYVYWNF